MTLRDHLAKESAFAVQHEHHYEDLQNELKIMKHFHFITD